MKPTIKNALRAEMERQGLNKSQLSKLAKMSYPHVFKLMNPDSVGMESGTAERLAAALGCEWVLRPKNSEGGGLPCSNTK